MGIAHRTDDVLREKEEKIHGEQCPGEGRLSWSRDEDFGDWDQHKYSLKES